jgi:hypothetical protein
VAATCQALTGPQLAAGQQRVPANPPDSAEKRTLASVSEVRREASIVFGNNCTKVDVYVIHQK